MKEISQLTALKDHIFSDASISVVNHNLLQNYAGEDLIIFISLCNTKERAHVVKGKGKTLESAWKNAERNAQLAITDKKIDVIWAKADIVNSVKEIRTKDLNIEVVSNHFRNFLRKGIAFDSNFNFAFLETEVNGNKMITYYTEKQISNMEVDYDSVILNLKNINHYLKFYYDNKGLTAIPDSITLFTTIGFFCDEPGFVYDLYSGELDCSRRAIHTADNKVIEKVIIDASMYLYGLIKPDGQFTYGYFPIFDNEIEGYNIARHTSTIWSLINLYRMTGNDELVPKLNAAINFLLEGNVVYKNDVTAYVVERAAGEIKLGGNGVAVIMLTEYMDVFETDKYVDMVKHLANGILQLQNQYTGEYYHVLNFPDYSPKDEFRVVYYDGEATFALTRAYTFTREQIYLDGAAAAVKNFIEKNYTKHRDHWVAYALNEITKYIPDPRYYEFALRNVKVNLSSIYRRTTTYHTYLELLMTGWQTYKRLIDSGIVIEYLEGFDVKYFAETIYKRAFHMLNGYFYPEVAMYMKSPNKVVNSFFVRHHNFRVRIDDVQHFIGGYYFYTLYFDDIRPYLSDDFLRSINSGL